MSLLLFRRTKHDLTPKQLIAAVISLGVPTEIMRGPNGTWGLRMPSTDDAADAVWVLEKHIDRLRNQLGDRATVTRVSALPDNLPFVTKPYHGRAER